MTTKYEHLIKSLEKLDQSKPLTTADLIAVLRKAEKREDKERDSAARESDIMMGR